MISTYVAFKDEGDKTLAFTLDLDAGETLTDLTVGAVSPVTTPPLIVTLDSVPIDPNVELYIEGGLVGSSYGVPLTVTTDQRIFVLMVAVSVEASVFQPYASVDPTSFSDLLGSIDAGNAALATSVFMLPQAVDTSSISAGWELMDAQGTVYSSGTAYDTTLQNLGPSKSITIGLMTDDKPKFFVVDASSNGANGFGSGHSRPRIRGACGLFRSSVRETRSPAAMEVTRAGICETNPSPMESSV